MHIRQAKHAKPVSGFIKGEEMDFSRIKNKRAAAVLNRLLQVNKEGFLIITKKKTQKNNRLPAVGLTYP